MDTLKKLLFYLIVFISFSAKVFGMNIFSTKGINIHQIRFNIIANLTNEIVKKEKKIVELEECKKIAPWSEQAHAAGTYIKSCKKAIDYTEDLIDQIKKSGSIQIITNTINSIKTHDYPKATNSGIVYTKDFDDSEKLFIDMIHDSTKYEFLKIHTAKQLGVYNK